MTLAHVAHKTQKCVISYNYGLPHKPLVDYFYKIFILSANFALLQSAKGIRNTIIFRQRLNMLTHHY